MIVNKFFKSIKNYGVKGTTKRVLGIEKCQEQIDTLYYLLNLVTDITKIGPTKDEALRIMQVCNAELLHIFDKLCTKHNLRYWLDAGTLLGAVRHQGFIPWDDDLDVSMPREDYDKVIPLMKNEMEKYGIVVRWGGYFDDRGYMARLAFAYKTVETGVWMDIFPLDSCDYEGSAVELEPTIEKNISEYQKYYFKHERKDSVQQLTEKKLQIFDSILSGSKKVWFGPAEWQNDVNFIIDNEDLFPLQRIGFEGYDLNVPVNYKLYLSKRFGNNYMNYPHSGILHHTDPDGGLAQDRAKKHNIDMNEVLDYLKSVYSDI